MCHPEWDRVWNVRGIMNRVEQEPNTGCWLWTGAVIPVSGYGQMRYGKGTPKKAHRVSYEIFVGPIPDGLYVCHRCDTPLCVNPDHLFLGTAKDNAQDAMRKGRYAHQSQTHCINGHAKTPDNIAVYMRKKGSTVTLCKICMATYAHRSYLKRKALRQAA